MESVKKPGIVRFQSPVLPAGGKELQLGGLKIYSTFDSTFGKHSLILDKALQVANLEALVRMKLIAFRRKDQVHLLDLIGVGLLDATWPARLPPPLGARLQQLLDDPNG